MSNLAPLWLKKLITLCILVDDEKTPSSSMGLEMLDETKDDGLPQVKSDDPECAQGDDEFNDAIETGESCDLKSVHSLYPIYCELYAGEPVTSNGVYRNKREVGGMKRFNSR